MAPIYGLQRGALMWTIYLNPREREALKMIAFDRQTQQKQRFVRALAEYLTHDVARHSIGLELGDPTAQVWGKVRRESTLQGYPTTDEAERTIGAFLGVPTPERK